MIRTRLFTFSRTVHETEEKINEWHRLHDKYYIEKRLPASHFCVHSTSVGHEVFAVTYRCDFD